MATQNSIDSQDPIQTALGGTGIASPTAHKLLVGAGSSALTQIAVGTNGQFLGANTSADPSWQSLPYTPPTWVTVSSSSTQAMTSNTGYLCTYSGAAQLTLPTSSNVGDMMWIIGKASANTWEITYTTGQSIKLQASSTTATTGNLKNALTQPQLVTLVCITANTTWSLDGTTANYTFT